MLLSGRSVFLALLLDLHVMADSAAHHRAGDRMVAGKVSANPSDCGTAQATGSEARGCCEKYDENGGFEAGHDVTPEGGALDGQGAIPKPREQIGMPAVPLDGSDGRARNQS